MPCDELSTRRYVPFRSAQLARARRPSRRALTIPYTDPFAVGQAEVDLPGQVSRDNRRCVCSGSVIDQWLWLHGWNDMNRLHESARGPAPRQISMPEPFRGRFTHLREGLVSPERSNEKLPRLVIGFDHAQTHTRQLIKKLDICEPIWRVFE